MSITSISSSRKIFILRNATLKGHCIKCSKLIINELDNSSCLSCTIRLAAEGVKCDNCARHCPTEAIRMVEHDGRRVPAIDTERCIGCGACEHLCPSRPFSAIYVEGNQTHRTL
ncbi:MAG: 4Fe-4S dicluster domain-containing protein [Alistipes sp.]|nr:4Fe-4S dicluster domain-containing protein [Alistipes sp.]